MLHNTQDSVQPLLHPVPVACRILGIGRTLFYELVKNDDIQLVKIGNRSLVPDSVLRTLVARLTEKSS